MTTEEKALEILGRLTSELDAIGVEYQIMFGVNNEKEKFGKMVFSDKFNVYRTIESLKMTLAATEKMRDRLESQASAKEGIFAEPKVQ